MIGWIFAAFSLVTAIFLAKELVKKFGFERTYALTANVVRWNYEGNEKHGISRGMHTVVLKGPPGHFFAAKIAFKLILPFGIEGVDTFGCIASTGDGAISFSTYLGRGRCDFLFFITQIDQSQVTVEIDPVGAPEPMDTYPPHWWQRLGFWG